MITSIVPSIPICPVCSALLTKRYVDDTTYFACPHCKGAYKVVGHGKADNELLISDNALDKVPEDND